MNRRFGRGVVACAISAVVGPFAPFVSDAQDTTTTTSVGPTLPPSTSSPSHPTTATATTATATTASPETSTSTTQDPTPPSWTLMFGGDTLLTRRITDRTTPFARIRPLMQNADLALVNLETALTTGGTAASKEFTFRSPPEFAQLLADAGIDAVSLANNHTLDFGLDSFIETTEHLRAAGVQTAGAGIDLDDALTPASFDVKGVRVAVLAATQIIPAFNWLATATRPGMVGAGKHQLDENARILARRVQTATFDHDVVVVIMHWGFEGDGCPNGTQQLVAEMLFDAGATAVLGAHPHVLQPIVERSDNKVVAYSMGNFIWDPRSGSTADTGLLELVFEGDVLVDTVFHPHRLDSNGWASAVTRQSDVNRITARTKAKCPDRRPDRSRSRRS